MFDLQRIVPEFAVRDKDVVLVSGEPGYKAFHASITLENAIYLQAGCLLIYVFFSFLWVTAELVSWRYDFRPKVGCLLVSGEARVVGLHSLSHVLDGSQIF